MQRFQVYGHAYSSVYVRVVPGGGYTTVSDIACDE
jgi:hypothetical protein